MPAFIFSIEKDLLIPPFEQEILAKYLPSAQFLSFDSTFGHDGFLIETAVLREALGRFMT
jgi:homoserine O-acetyltransferase